ncbi:hypothetical protein [Sorangium sp. So ce887]|uniref:hypothetical protein n=1 Tax=Sorangium sp. So ce887 TaxID=3133324 RepID=UPI003F639EF0
MDDPPEEEKKSLVELSINFRANLFRKKDLPKKLTTERGRIEEGIWGMQELNVGDDDFVMVFGRTWEGVTKDTFEGVLDTPAERLGAGEVKKP